MIDLHSHTYFSDGVLGPSELARRAEEKGLAVLGLTDHGDISNIDFIVPRIVKTAKKLNEVMNIRLIPGIELTHVPPAQIEEAVVLARSLGAQLVIIHGETIVEPVAKGTNRAGILAGADIIAHPGLIDESDVRLAVEKGVFLEITARKGHSLTNGHVAKLAVKFGARMVIDTDSHAPEDLIDSDTALKVVVGAGLCEADFIGMQANAHTFVV